MARPKVGDSSRGEQTLFVQDLEHDTTYAVDLTTLPGLFDAAGFQREQGMDADSSRSAYSFGPYWSPDGQFAVLDVRSSDNKHRWIAQLDVETGVVTSLDHQHDDAWIAGPGISWWGGRSDVGWMPDSERFWFQSERSGYSHLYTVDVSTGQVVALTDGDFEVFSPQLSRDGTTWYFQSSEGSPHERHAYRMHAEGGTRMRITRLPGRNDFQLSPSERHLGLLYSQSNRPPEVLLEPVGAMAAGNREAPVRYLTSSPTDQWLAYSWRDPEIVHVPASDGAQIPARNLSAREPEWRGCVLRARGRLPPERPPVVEWLLPRVSVSQLARGSRLPGAGSRLSSLGRIWTGLAHRCLPAHGRAGLAGLCRRVPALLARLLGLSPSEWPFMEAPTEASSR